MRCYYTSLEYLTIKRFTVSSIGEDTEELEFLYVAGMTAFESSFLKSSTKNITQ